MVFWLKTYLCTPILHLLLFLYTWNIAINFYQENCLGPNWKTNIWFSVRCISNILGSIYCKRNNSLIWIEIIMTLVMSFMLEESEEASNILQGKNTIHFIHLADVKYARNLRKYFVSGTCNVYRYMHMMMPISQLLSMISE